MTAQPTAVAFLLHLRAQQVEQAWRKHNLEELFLVHVVGGIGNDLERRDDVCHDGVVAHSASLRQATRDPCANQRCLERVAYFMSPVQDGVVAPAERVGGAIGSY